MKTMLSVCLLSLSLAAPLSYAYAQSPQDDSILVDQYITTQEFVEARVLRVKNSDRILVVRGANRGDVREFIVPEDAEITIRGAKARLRHIRRGDVVMVTMSPRNERVVINAIKVPETPVTLAQRIEEPVEEALPAVLPQTASQWHSVLFFGLFAGALAAFIRAKRKA